MRCLPLVVGVICGGCASYTQTKIDLTEQIRRGIASTREATIEQHRALEALAEAQVARLDGAFDADVKARGALSAEWVIAHRKAYVTARDAMVDQKQSLRVGQATLEGNLQSIDLALGQLQRLHTIEQRVRLPEVLK